MFRICSYSSHKPRRKPPPLAFSAALNASFSYLNTNNAKLQKYAVFTQREMKGETLTFQIALTDFQVLFDDLSAAVEAFSESEFLEILSVVLCWRLKNNSHDGNGFVFFHFRATFGLSLDRFLASCGAGFTSKQ
ncbi:unnamed protein product [Vicia faba]|uniref:Uncharacterized protein n=1 Tax=Vicia faba TaxID=3906 RepID=A0AAV1AGN0_VICFA|nr:unnamed protein product [Vicia faba]